MVNYKLVINESVNFWFKTPKRDSISPAETILEFNNLFLKGLKYHKLGLVCSEKDFRLYMCEAVCTMFLAKKKNTIWQGPLSEMPRPEGWASSNEIEWLDILKSNHLGYDFFDGIWSRIEKTIWENIVPEWRTSFEIIALHYIAVKQDLLVDDYIAGYDNNMFADNED